MRKFTMLMAALAMLSVSYLNAQDLSIGVKAGLNIADASVTADGSDIKTSSITSFHIGVIGIYPINDQIQFQFGGLLSGKGTSYTGGSVDIKPWYIEVPLNFGYVIDAGSAKIVPYAGLYLAMGIMGKVKSGTESRDITFGSSETDDMKALDMGLNLGGAIQFGSVVVNAQYQLGLSNISPSPDANAKTRTISLGIAYLFTSGK
jgi:hypothetical protein